MAVTREDLLGFVKSQRGQATIAGIALDNEYPLERFIFDLLDAYAKAEDRDSYAFSGGTRFVQALTSGNIEPSGEESYTFTRSFQVTGRVVLEVEKVSTPY